MNWKERVKPSNSIEAGCYSFVLGLAILVFFFFSGLDEYFSYFAAVLWLSFYIFKLGREALFAYEVRPLAAYGTSAMIIMAYVLAWIGLINLCVKIIEALLPNRLVGWLVFVAFMFLAYIFYRHMIRFRTTIFEQWLGWQPKEGIADG